MISYQDFKNQTINQSMLGTNSDNRGQCMGYFDYFLQLSGLPFVGGNAKDAYDSAPTDFFDKLPSDAQVEQGDVFVCGVPWGVNPYFNPNQPESDNNVHYYGHIGFVDQPQIFPAFMGLEQNGVLATPHKVQIVFHQTRNGFLGFLRLKERVKMMDVEDAKDCYRLGLHREPENDQVWRPLVGKKFSDEATAMRAGSEWLGQNDVLLRAYPEALKTIDALNTKIQELEAQPTPQAVAQIKQQSQAILDTANHLTTSQ